jgi:hypothetical protein
MQDSTNEKYSTNTRKLECSWPAGQFVSLEGMSPEHRERVREIGLRAWMEEYAKKMPEPFTRAPRLTRIMCDCVVCSKRFPAQRSDAKYCSHKCQLRGHRSGLAFRGSSENINALCET